MRCTVPVPIPSDLATFKIPTPFASCFRTFRSVALSIFGRPSFTPWAPRAQGNVYACRCSSCLIASTRLGTAPVSGSRPALVIHCTLAATLVVTDGHWPTLSDPNLGARKRLLQRPPARIDASEVSQRRCAIGPGRGRMLRCTVQRMATCCTVSVSNINGLASPTLNYRHETQHLVSRPRSPSPPSRRPAERSTP